MKPTRRGPEVTISIVTLLLAGLGVALQAVALTPSLTIRISVLVLLGICVAAGLLAAATHKASVAFGAATVATLVVISLLTMIALTPPSTSPSTQVPDTGSQQPSDTVDSRLSLVLAEVQDQTAEFEYDSAIDITIRNAGRQRAALTRADLTIVDYAFVQTCTCGGTIPVSGSYDVEFPRDPTLGLQLPVTLHQQIGPDELDRFKIRIKGPTLRDEIVNYEYCVEAASSLIFRVSVRINQDSAPSAELGDFVVATNNILQLPPDEQGAKDWCGPDGDASCVSEVAKCGMNARSQLLRMLDVADAVKSDAATRFVKRLKGG